MADNPAEGVGEEEVLGGIDETFVAMTHVQVDHAESLVGPDNGEVTEVHYVLDAEWIVLLGDAEQDLYVRVQAWAWIPLIELRGRSDELLWHGTGDDMLVGVALNEDRLWWPVVAEERTAAEELVVPRPMGVAVVIG